MYTVALISALAIAFVGLASASDPCAVQGCRIKFVVYSETQRRFFIQFFSAAWTSSNPLFILNKENAGHYLAEEGCNGEWKAHMMNELGDKESEFFFRVEGNAKVNITINDGPGPSSKLSAAKIQIEYCGQEPQVVAAVIPKTTGADSADVKQGLGKQAVAGSEPFVPNKLSASSGFLKPNGQADLPLTGDNVPAEDSSSRSANTADSQPELTLQKKEAIANMCNVVCAKL
jgi:hypothetical protein